MHTEAAKAVLRANWRAGTRRDGTPFGFTCPSPRRYKHQWYWDSCFHAIAWTHVDRERAKEELRTLLRAGRADGFVPHTAFWPRSRASRATSASGSRTSISCTRAATCPASASPP